MEGGEREGGGGEGGYRGPEDEKHDGGGRDEEMERWREQVPHRSDPLFFHLAPGLPEKT